MPWPPVACTIMSAPRNATGKARSTAAAQAARSRGSQSGGKDRPSTSSAAQRRGDSRSVGASPVLGSGCSSRRTPTVRAGSAIAPRTTAMSRRSRRRRSNAARACRSCNGAGLRSKRRAKPPRRAAPSAMALQSDGRRVRAALSVRTQAGEVGRGLACPSSQERRGALAEAGEGRYARGGPIVRVEPSAARPRHRAGLRRSGARAEQRAEAGGVDQRPAADLRPFAAGPPWRAGRACCATGRRRRWRSPACRPAY